MEYQNNMRCVNDYGRCTKKRVVKKGNKLQLNLLWLWLGLVWFWKMIKGISYHGCMNMDMSKSKQGPFCI